MLTLGVNAGDYITIGSDVVVQVVKVGSQFRLAIHAPKDMKIKRSEHLPEEDTPACIEKVRRLSTKPREYGFKRRV